MLFDQNMIIDATRGSIARFVNHSCEPNSRMTKWIVNGKPRMALFAGDRPVMTGEELTYDYNFDPFSAKNVQECRCGAENCRGILGPRPKDKPKPVTESIKQAVKYGKRKLKDFLGGEKGEKKNPKKRKIAPVKRNGGAKVAAKGLKRTLSKAVDQAAKRGKAVVVKKTQTRVLKTYGPGKGKKSVVSSRNSSLTLVNGSPGKGKKVVSRKVSKTSTRKVSTGRVRKVSAKTKGSITKNIVRSVRQRTPRYEFL
jgi:histone-lysine N-methyltransferase ASH1L